MGRRWNRRGRATCADSHPCSRYNRCWRGHDLQATCSWSRRLCSPANHLGLRLPERFCKILRNRQAHRPKPRVVKAPGDRGRLARRGQRGTDERAYSIIDGSGGDAISPRQGTPRRQQDRRSARAFDTSEIYDPARRCSIKRAAAIEFVGPCASGVPHRETVLTVANFLSFTRQLHKVAADQGIQVTELGSCLKGR